MSISLNIADNSWFGIDSKREFGDSCVAAAIYWQLARRRSGSASTKLMSEISGTTAKPYKQKGTGRARQGSKRSVQFVGGRTCHGPRPRSFDFTLPKKVRKNAVTQALLAKISDNRVAVVEFSQNAKKTAALAAAFGDKKISSAVLLYSENTNKDLVLSARNIKNVKPLSVSSINSLDLVKYDYVVGDKETLLKLKNLV